jgi:glycosyltransferase involved in cell wall biosynthesis
MEPLISVIVVTYNRAHFLKDALDSIVGQTFKDYEIILVDDGSTDNTKEIVGQYKGIHYIYQEHAGISKARNTAIKAARGKWIATLDSDDMWKEEKLQKQVAYLEAHPDCRIVFTAFHNYTDIPIDELNKQQNNLMQTSGDKRYLPSALIDAKLFDEIGLYDEAKVWGEDIDWVFRLSFFKVEMGHYINEVLYLRKVHGSNISVTTKEISNLEFWKMVIEAYRKTKKQVILKNK